MKQFYAKKVESQIINFYQSLSEKDRRRYAAVEALKLPHGGQLYMCTLLGCDNKTIQQGLKELDDEEELKKSA